MTKVTERSDHNQDNFNLHKDTPSLVFNVMHLNISDVFWIFDLVNQKYLYISPSIYKLR